MEHGKTDVAGLELDEYDRKERSEKSRLMGDAIKHHQSVQASFSAVRRALEVIEVTQFLTIKERL